MLGYKRYNNVRNIIGQSSVGSYDNCGNPKNYLGATLNWTRGRMLASYNGNGVSSLYTYNGSGIRTKKVANGITHSYHLMGNQILREDRSDGTNSSSLIFYYGTDGVTGFNYQGADYYYLKNLQGDITAIYNTDGEKVAEYVYDAWGKVLTSTGLMAEINPFRYRGYYYDAETKLYYLNSRYYDPEMCRFINADDISYLDSESINGLNLYVYCLNNPLMLTDSNGTSAWSDFWNSTAGKIVGTIGVALAVVAVTALTVVTLGAAAPLAAAVIVGAAISGGINLIEQGTSKGYSNVDFVEVGIQALSGAAIGAASILAPGVGGMFLKAGISSLTSVAMGAYKGKSFGEIATGAILSFGLSMGLQGAGKFVSKLGIGNKVAQQFQKVFSNKIFADYVGDQIFDSSIRALDGLYSSLTSIIATRIAAGVGGYVWRKLRS